MVCLPEHFAYHDKGKSFGEEFKGFEKSVIEENLHWFEQYCQLAIDNQVWLSLGCYPEFKMYPNGKKALYNTHYIIN